MRQEVLIDTNPLADLWERVAHPQAVQLQPMPGSQFKKQVQAPAGLCPVRAMGGWGWPCPMLGTGCSSVECKAEQAPTPAPEPKPVQPPQSCLRCGKQSPKMFCSARCRAKWIAGMNAFANRLAKTAIVGTDQQALL